MLLAAGMLFHYHCGWNIGYASWGFGMDWYLSLFRNFKVILGVITGVLFVVVLSGLAKGLSLEDWRNLALVLAGLFGLPLAVWRSGVAAKQVEVATKQVELSEAGQNIDRYQKGAAMLGDARLSVREAGVFGLTELAENNFDTYHATVIKLLCSFVRDRSSEERQEQSRKFELQQEREEDRKRQERAKIPPMGFMQPQLRPEVRRELVDIAPDCQTALYSLSELNRIARDSDYHISPQAFDLRATNLSNANFAGLVMRGAYLRRANLYNALLHTADFKNANLSKTNMTRADLRGVNFSDGNLAGAILKNVDLRNAYLNEANLEAADLSGALLSGADLAGANLAGVKNVTYLQFAKAKNVNSDFLNQLKSEEKAEAEELAQYNQF